MGKVQVLDFQVANLIAAGEVVERPASCVKELLENALDAGATEITVEIKHGGVSFIRVSDNGCGIAVEDLPIAIKRHATSKIATAADLDGIVTLGFRGEALAAIASVSHLRIMTKQRTAKFGALLVSEYGKVTDVTEIGCQNGTTVIVENLFANVPARRKFLKRDASEALAVSSIVEKLAISHPEIAFKLLIDGNLKIATPGDNRLISAIRAALGKEYAERLVMVKNMTEGIEVMGYISRPEAVKSNRSGQNFFVNDRYVRSKTAMAALEQAFDSYCEVGKFPFCVLFINIHPTLVDVNVHPTKLEVKFSNERAVFDAVYCAVRNTLSDSALTGEPILEPRRVTPTERGLYNAFVPIADRLADVPTPTVPKEKLPDEVTTIGEIVGEPTVRDMMPPDTAFDRVEKERKAALVPVTPTPSAVQAAQTPASPANPQIPQEKTSDSFLSDLAAITAGISDDDGKTTDVYDKKQPDVAKKREEIPEINEPKAGDPFAEKPYRVIGVAFHAYIMVEVGETTLIIDKHAAHERILFEKMKRNREKSRIAASSQMLMLPIEILLTPEELAALEEYREELLTMGFGFTANDHGAALSAIPMGIAEEEATALFASLLSGLSDGTTNVDVTRNIFYEKALYQASCKAAMKAGIIDSPENVEWLVAEVMNNPDIRYCPHGRPIAFELSRRDMEKFFKRT
ncbi:MAG: DNA mismatch repair endonuclease MutL [Clostridia bacterium]|nr:DNA mismatch repair endonuclease MutL [Clostridia bacterium]